MDIKKKAEPKSCPFTSLILGIDYFWSLFLMRVPANPTMPVPMSRMVAGSGIGAGPVALTRTLSRAGPVALMFRPLVVLTNSRVVKASVARKE